jgi:hypoxanthine phosphoribosyltransferase
VKNFVSRAMGHSSVSLTWEDPELNETANLKKKNWSKISDKEMNNIDWSLYINEDVEKAEDNYNKIMKKDKAVDEEGNIEENINVSDWRR